ncbi:MAG: Riboflavin kinase, partial [Thermomicrobiales bacterium]|nr:Riboflavin kinase [Thermomicrobiales bacterium]
SADLYGEEIDVEICERLRGDATFSGLDELVEQLRRDEAAARSFLATVAAARPATSFRGH